MPRSEPLDLLVRAATLDDLATLRHLDAETGPPDPGDRARWLQEWIEGGECFAASIAGRVAGYGVLHYHFYHAGMIEMLVVRQEVRRQGIARALLRHLSAICSSPKIWVSTNLSNLPMQALLASEGFRISGFIEGLDEGDPELVYTKTAAR